MKVATSPTDEGDSSTTHTILRFSRSRPLFSPVILHVSLPLYHPDTDHSRTLPSHCLVVARVSYSTTLTLVTKSPILPPSQCLYSFPFYHTHTGQSRTLPSCHSRILPSPQLIYHSTTITYFTVIHSSTLILIFFFLFFFFHHQHTIYI